VVILAEEKNENENQNKQPEGSKKKIYLGLTPLHAIIGGLVIMAILTIITGYFATHKSIKVEKPEEKQHAEKTVEMGTMFPLEPFIVNLIDYNGRRYLKTTIELEIEGLAGEDKKKEGEGEGGANKELEKMVPFMRNIIINILSSKTFKDISSVEGKDSLRQEIAFRINNAMTKGKIKNVYFKEFVIQ